MTRGLLVLLGGSLLLKLFLLIPAHSSYPVRDSGDYHSTARHLYKSGNYAGSRTPVYPVLLWGTMETMALAGPDHLAPMPKKARRIHPSQKFTDLDLARLIQVLLSTLTAWLMYWIGRELIDHRTGLFAAGIFAFYPEFIGFSHLLWSETLFILLNSIWLLLILRGLREEKVASFVLAGFVFGIASLTRQVIFSAMFVVIVPWIFLMRPRPWKSTARFAAALVLATFVTIAPWTLRNYLSYDEFVLIVPNSGIGLLFGASENVSEEMKAAGIQGLMSSFERDRLAGEAAMEIIRKDPLAYVERMVKVNIVGLWQPGSQIIDHLRMQSGLNALAAYPMAPGWLGRGVVIVCIAAYGVVMVLGIVGAALAPGWRTTLLSLGLVLHVSALHTIVGGFHRHRLYVMPLFIIYAAFLLSRSQVQIPELVTRQRLGIAALGLAIFVTFCLVGDYSMLQSRWRSLGP